MLCHPAHSQDADLSLKELRARFDQQRSLLSKPITDLYPLYEKQLQTLRETAKSGGNLDQVLMIDEELRGYRDADYRPEQTFPELQRLRRIYEGERDRRAKEVAEVLPTYLKSYLDQLDKLEKELTRLERLEEALAVRGETEKIRRELESGTEMSTTLAAAADPEEGGSMKGIGFGSHSDPVGEMPRGFNDIVAIRLWERDTFDAGWVALRANGTLVTDKERRISAGRERIVAFDCSRGGGILMVLESGKVDSSLCRFQPSAEKEKELVDLVSVALTRTEGGSDQEAAVAVRRDGSLVWWGPAADRAGAIPPPEAARTGVASVTSERGTFTAVKTDGGLVEWRFDDDRRRGRIPDDLAGREYRQVSMSEGHSVGLLVDGSVVAWGDDSVGQRSVPPDLGPCVEVRTIGNALSLAKRRDGTWVAWGRDYGDIKTRLNGAKSMTHIAGKLFPPGSFAFAVWIETDEAGD